MRILLTGGGSGGHFYPLIAIAEQLNKIIDEQKLVGTKLYFMSDAPYDTEALLQNGLIFEKITTGKMRVYFSFKNITDIFKTAFACLRSIVTMFRLYPDVVISKGAFASFPALFAARLFRIPVIIHESDSVPGRVNRWAGKFARRIAISYPETAQSFPRGKVAHTGQPIRTEILTPAKEGGYEYLDLAQDLPVLVIMGGSQGAETINDAILAVLPDLVSRYQIIHQTGTKNLESVKQRAALLLKNNPDADRYKPAGFLNLLAMKMVGQVATVVITRAGSALFEIASWGTPAIVIPITKSNGDHQRKNAFTYARSGAAIVIEEANITPHTFLAEITNLMGDQARLKAMRESALRFAKPGAAYEIAKEATTLALEHEK